MLFRKAKNENVPNQSKESRKGSRRRWSSAGPKERRLSKSGPQQETQLPFTECLPRRQAVCIHYYMEYPQEVGTISPISICEETEARENEVTCLQSPSEKVVELGFESGSSPRLQSPGSLQGTCCLQ